MMLLAAAAMAFASCQKPEIDTPKDDYTPDYVTVSELTFTSGKPSLSGESHYGTKTEWNGTTIQWSAGDKIRMAYTHDGIWQNAEGAATAALYESAALAAAADVARFNVAGEFKADANAGGAYYFYGVYPSSIVSDAAFTSAPSLNVTIPAVQTPPANSYDPAADLMVAVSDEQATFTEGQEISLKWTRLVAHANITLKGLKGLAADETISSITLTANPDAAVTGTCSVNLEDKTLTVNAASNTLTVKGDNLSLVAAEGAHNVSFWAAFIPVNMTSLQVVVETENSTYTRNISECTLDFLKNKGNVLPINMAEVEPVVKPLAIEGVEVPSAIVNRGATVSFKAAGLQAGDKVVFSSDAYPGTHTVEAELTMTADGASFTVPASCYGINRMTLVRGDRSVELGSLSIAAAVGDVIGGGVVYYVSDGGVHGLIANKVNIGSIKDGKTAYDTESGNNMWGPESDMQERHDDDADYVVPGVGPTSTDIYTGKNNTAQCLISTKWLRGYFASWYYFPEKVGASEYCDEYSIVVDGVTYDDWFLPSKQELIELWNVSALMAEKDAALPYDNYWTSSEAEGADKSACAIYVNFWDRANLITGPAAKEGWKISVRPVRQF